MSVYDFNKHEFVNNHHHHLQHNNYIVGPSHYQNQAGGIDSNGNNCQAIARYQVENSYLNRGVGGGSLGSVSNYPTSTQHMDMSLPTTRPTSKTAMLVRQRRAMLEQLSCYLCKGFLIDATTVDECMDSFCKSCIVKHLREYNDCPKCHTTIHKTNPLSSIRSDKVLQDIVYKLIPGLYDDEMKRRREFYKGVLGTANTSSDDDDDTSSSSFAGKNSNMSSEQYGIVSHPKPFYKPTDVIKISIEPHTKDDCSDIYYDNKRQSIVTCFTTGKPKNSTNNNNQQQKPTQQRPINWSIFSTVDKSQFKTYLRCEAKLTAMHLKKFIAAKFNASKDDTVHLLYWNETVQEDYSLIDIAYIYDWRGIEHMRLFYIIERDLSNMNDQKEQFAQQSDGIEIRKVKLSRQSVATSTQPIKRVCIDPHPQYYDETTSKRHIVSSNTNGRNMRSKVNETGGSFATRSTSTGTIQAPILRSSGCSQASSQPNGNSSASTSRVAYMASGSSRETRQQTSAIEELNRAKQARENEARMTRKNGPIEMETNFNSSYLPNTNVSRSSSTSQREFDASVEGERSVSTYSRANGGGIAGVPSANCLQQKLSTAVEQYQEPIATTASNYRQLVPSLNSTKCSMMTTKAGSPAQSSVVTLASFTEARSNHVMSMTTSSATAMTNSYRNMMGIGGGGGGGGSNSSGAGTLKPMDTRTVNSAQAVMAQEMRPQSNSTQVAFSFVTERGITIVRRLPQRESPSSTTTLSSNNQTSNHQQASNSQISRLNASHQLPALPAPPSTSQPQPQSQSPRSTLSTTNSGESDLNHHNQQQQRANRSVTQHNKSLGNQVPFSSSPPAPKASPGAQSSAGGCSSGSGSGHSSDGGMGTTARHLIKVKPVYKTFVDPTKLKSPNLKKLGFTARH